MYQMCINCRWNSGCCNDTAFISTHQCLVEPRSFNFSSRLHIHHCSFSIRWWYKRGLVTKHSHFSNFKCTQQYKYLFIQNQVCLWSIRPLFSTYLSSGCGGSSLGGTLPASPQATLSSLSSLKWDLILPWSLFTFGCAQKVAKDIKQAS